MANHIDKPTLVEKVRSARQALNSFLGGLSAEQLTAPGPEGWSVKDHLAHLAAWTRKEIAVMSGQNASEGLGLPAGTYESYDFDEINAMLLPRLQALTLNQVVDEFNASHAALLDAVQAFPSEKLNQTYFNRPGTTWADAIAGNSYEHDQEHSDWIKELVKA